MKILSAIFATIIYIIGIELVSLWMFIPGMDATGFAMYGQFLQGLLQFVLIIFFIHLIYRKAEGRVWKKASLYGYVIAAVTGFCFVGLQVPLYKWYNEMAGTSLNIVFDFDGWRELRNINMLSVIFFIPVSEELFFRRWIQDKLQEVSQPYTGLLIATILFSSIHLGLTQIWLGWEMLDWHGAFITFWGGGIAGWLYMKFQSVGPSIIFHMCWNFMVVIV